jgi:tocopherol cyclase
MKNHFNISDTERNGYRLRGPLAGKGYDWWYHSFTGYNRKTGEAKSFFVEYFLCNPSLGRDVPVFGQLPENKAAGIRPSYLMVKAGTWGSDAVQLHRFYGWKDVSVSAGTPYSVCADGCSAGETSITGSISVSAADASAHPEYMCGSGTMKWNLSVSKKISFNVGYGAGRFFRKVNAFEMYWHAEGMKTEYSGTVVFNGTEYDVEPDTSYGYADKNWGSGFTSPWVWLSSCCLTSGTTGKKLMNSAFDVGGGRPKVFFIPLDRKLLSAFWYEGKEYEFNFSKFWTGARTSFECRETADEVIWHVHQENFRAAADYDITCGKKDMLLINYEAPDGTRRHNRLWNGGTGHGTVTLYDRVHGRLVRRDVIRAEHVGCEYGEYCEPDGGTL